MAIVLLFAETPARASWNVASCSRGHFAVCNPRCSGVHLSARTAKSLEVELRIAAKLFHHSAVLLARNVYFTATARDAPPFGVDGAAVGVCFDFGETPDGANRGELFCELRGHSVRI